MDLTDKAALVTGEGGCRRGDPINIDGGTFLN